MWDATHARWESFIVGAPSRALKLLFHVSLSAARQHCMSHEQHLGMDRLIVVVPMHLYQIVYVSLSLYMYM